jgi:hypothetical protein
VNNGLLCLTPPSTPAYAHHTAAEGTIRDHYT